MLGEPLRSLRSLAALLTGRLASGLRLAAHPPPRWAYTRERMPQVERDALEKPTPLRRAECLLDEFFHDRDTYPDDDFYSRTGICKLLAEEYHPLVRLAQRLWGVRSIRLLSHANPGPDAKIAFWWRQAATVQITCAHEGYDRALMREQMLAGDIVLPHQQRKRDKVTDRVVSKGSGAFEPSADVQVRVERILEAIAAKERRYYPGTEILLVHESPAGYEYLQEGRLHEQVCETVLARDSRYQRIYVNYGDHLKRVK